MPLVKLFYEQNGLNNMQLFLLHGVYSLIIALLEIPSGYLADTMGRKRALVIGTTLDFAGFAMYAISSGFWGFLFAEIALGIGVSFISGSDSAMLYDTLADMKRDKEYIKTEGRISALGNFSETAASVIISLLLVTGIHNFRMAYAAQAAVAFLGIPAALMLKDPESHIKLVHSHFNDILVVVRHALFNNKALRNILVFSSVIGFSSLSMAWFAQIFFFEINLRDQLYGVLWAALNLTVGIGSLLAFRIKSNRIHSGIWALILFCTAGGFMLCGLFVSYWSLIVLFIFYLVRGVSSPLMKDYLNQLTDSSVRATILSIRSFIIRIMYAILGPILGWVSDIISLSAALLMAGSAILISGSVMLAAMARERKGA
jgi:MFS family permease